MIFSILLMVSLVVSILSLALALKGKKRYYWLAAIGIYIFSVIAAWSIGQVTVGLTFVFLALAIGDTLNLIKSKFQIAICAGVGILAGLGMVVYIDDAYLFFPLSLLG